MLILKQAEKKTLRQPQMDSFALGSFAVALSVPFGLLSAQLLHSWAAGLVLGSSLFTYSILLARLFRRQPPLLFSRLFPRRELMAAPKNASEIAGLRLDYVGGKDPQDNLDGIIHARGGELQRILKCTLPHRISTNAQALLLEMLFADLARFEKARFQLIFPEADSGQQRSELYIVVTKLNTDNSVDKDELPPLIQVKRVLDGVIERLITLGVTPKILNAREVRQLISEEFGKCGNRSQLNKDWRSVGVLGWEPSFRDKVLRSTERCMQINERRAITINVDQLPATRSFSWLSAALSDIPSAHASIFISPWVASDPISKLKLSKTIKKHGDNALLTPIAAQMSFYFRFDGKDVCDLECEVATARNFFRSLGIGTGNAAVRNQQLNNWRATLPCAQEQSSSRHLIAFMPSNS